MFSITTIASSTTMPVARMMPKSVSVLIEKPSSLTNAKAPTSETGIVIAGMSVLRQLCRKRKMTRTTRTMASASVLSDLADRVLDDVGRVEARPDTCSPGGK